MVDDRKSHNGSSHIAYKYLDSAHSGWIFPLMVKCAFTGARPEANGPHGGGDAQEGFLQRPHIPHQLHLG